MGNAPTVDDRNVCRRVRAVGVTGFSARGRADLVAGDCFADMDYGSFRVKTRRACRLRFRLHHATETRAKAGRSSQEGNVQCRQESRVLTA